MPDSISTVERAAELARSGEHLSVNDIRQRLKREGHHDVRIELRSPAINRELVALLKAANR